MDPKISVIMRFKSNVFDNFSYLNITKSNNDSIPWGQETASNSARLTDDLWDVANMGLKSWKLDLVATHSCSNNMQLQQDEFIEFDQFRNKSFWRGENDRQQNDGVDIKPVGFE